MRIHENPCSNYYNMYVPTIIDAYQVITNTVNIYIYILNNYSSAGIINFCATQ